MSAVPVKICKQIWTGLTYLVYSKWVPTGLRGVYRGLAIGTEPPPLLISKIYGFHQGAL